MISEDLVLHLDKYKLMLRKHKPELQQLAVSKNRRTNTTPIGIK